MEIILLGLRRGLVLRFYVAKLWMISHPKKKMDEYFEKGRVTPLGDPEYSMSQKEFQKMHQNFHLPIALFDAIFNEKFCFYVTTIVSYFTWNNSFRFILEGLQFSMKRKKNVQKHLSTRGVQRGSGVTGYLN